MKLIDLEPTFYIWKSDNLYERTDKFTEADGIGFLCPKCYTDNPREDKTITTHSIICWKRHIPQTTPPTLGRWNFSGTDYNDLTLTPSVNLDIRNEDGTRKYPNECNAHFHISNGEIT